jgi:phytanoyl-CoA hydroxylase
VRWSLDLRYQGSNAPNNVDEAPSDATPERDPVTMACYPPEADFVIRDTQHPEREIRSAEAFNALRSRFNSAKVYSPGRGWKSLQEK